MEDEQFIQDTELLGYINEAIDECEAEIHGLYEDYFIKRAYIALVTGTEEYALPTDIYAHKIRRIIYKSGSTVYTVERMRDWMKFEEYAIESVNQASTRYKYMLINETAGAPKILLSPSAKETSSTVMRVWYLRNAARLTAFTDTCDIPEFVPFILQFVKLRCYEKEGHPNAQQAAAMLDQQRAQMQSTLAAMVPDGDNEIEPDLRIYGEMS